MSFTSFLADDEAVRDRGYWMVHFYLTDPSGNEEILRVSNRGEGTRPASITVGATTIPANTAYRKRLVRAPSISQSLWDPRQFLSHSIPSFGECTLRNADGGLDQYRPAEGYRWINARCEVFFADQWDIPNTIGLVVDGRCGHPQFTLGEVVVPVLGLESDFNVATSTRVYRGTSYGLELFGDRTVSFGTPSAINITGNMTGEVGWVWLEGIPSVDRRVWGWIGATTYPWRFGFLTTGAVVLVCTIGGVTESVTSAFTLSTFKPYHLSFVVSGRDVTFELWDDDAQTLTTDLHTNAFSSSTRQGNSGGTYLLRTDSDATFKPWFDEMRVWNVALTTTERAANRFRPLSATIPATCVHRLGMDDGAGTTVTDSSATAANGTISGVGTSTWLWMMEGGPELAGRAKPDVWGQRFGVAPILVSPIHQVYQFAGRGVVQSVTSYEGGNAHTMVATAASMRALITTTPSAANSLPYLARGYFRLGSVPTLPVSATVEGYNTGGYISTAGPISRAIITGRGPKLTDPGDLDTASFTAYGSAAPATIGIALYTPNAPQEYVAPVLDMVNVGTLGWWGYVGSSVLFHIERFVGPDSTADYNISKAIIDIEDVHPPPPVIYEVVVRYRKNDVVMSEDQVAGAVKGTANWTQWTLPWQEKRATDEVLARDYAGAGGLSLALDTALYLDADAQTLANTLLGLVKGVREVFIVNIRTTGVQINIGMTLTLTFQYQDGTQRFGLDGTKKFLVIATELVLQEGRVRVTVWG